MPHSVMSIFPETGIPENEAWLESGRGGGRARSGGARAARFGSACVSGVQDATQQGQYGTELSSEELGAHRAALLAQKQVALESTIDKHDDMVRRNPVLAVVELNSLQVRELFHMENFKNMTLYNPKVCNLVSLPANATDVISGGQERSSTCFHGGLLSTLIPKYSNFISFPVQSQVRPR